MCNSLSMNNAATTERDMNNFDDITADRTIKALRQARGNVRLETLTKRLVKKAGLCWAELSDGFGGDQREAMAHVRAHLRASKNACVDWTAREPNTWVFLSDEKLAAAAEKDERRAAAKAAQTAVLVALVPFAHTTENEGGHEIGTPGHRDEDGTVWAADTVYGGLDHEDQPNGGGLVTVPTALLAELLAAAGRL